MEAGGVDGASSGMGGAMLIHDGTSGAIFFQRVWTARVAPPHRSEDPLPPVGDPLPDPTLPAGDSPAPHPPGPINAI